MTQTYRCTGQSTDGSRADTMPCADHQDMNETQASKHLNRTGHEYDMTETRKPQEHRTATCTAKPCPQGFDFPHGHLVPQEPRIVAECWTCWPGLKPLWAHQVEFHKSAGHDVRPVRSEDSQAQSCGCGADCDCDPTNADCRCARNPFSKINHQ